MELVYSSEISQASALERFADSLWTDVAQPNGDKALPDVYRLALIAQALRAARQLESLSALKATDAHSGILILRVLAAPKRDALAT